MTIWWLLWAILSFILLGSTIWSLIILQQQKKAWAEFAKRKDLLFKKGKFSAPCEIEGTIEGMNIGLFSATQQKEDARKNRQLTVLQLKKPKGYVDALAAGTPEMLPFLNSLTLITPHPLEDKNWDKKNHHIYSRNKEVVSAYLTPERIALLNKILKVGNSDNIVVMEAEETVFRFETSNPLTELSKIEALVSKLVMAMKKLEPSEEEYQKLQALYPKKDKAEEGAIAE